MKAKFCSQCARPVVTHQVAGRWRELCPHCGTVFYRNPLPVAAAVVLNERHEVLLIKRRHEPRQGLWCLPMGFAELDESIAEAALRELTEETGLTGRVVRLLAADSLQAEPYGDLLVITFEIEKANGTERAGDDAADLAYFAITDLPPLAFRANRQAMRACLQAHEEQWAIQESFRQLNATAPEALLSDALVAFIARHARQIARAWLREVTANPTTPSYARIDPAELSTRAIDALSQFSRWLSGAGDRADVVQFYRQLGAERRTQGFALPEVIRSLSLLRQQTLEHAMRRRVRKGVLDAYTVMELHRRIFAFFDRAQYHTACGYLRALVP